MLVKECLGRHVRVVGDERGSQDLLSRWLVVDHVETVVLRLLEVEGLLGLAEILTLHRCQLHIAAHRAIVVVLHLHSLAQHLLLLLLLERLQSILGH